MADTINAKTRDLAQQRSQNLQGIGDEELAKLIAQKKQEQTLKGLGGVASQTGGAFLQLAGVEPQKGPSQIDELAKLQALQMKQTGEERQARLDEEKILKAQQDRELAVTKAKQEAETATEEANKKVELEGGTKPSTPTEAAVVSKPSGDQVPVTAKPIIKALPTTEGGLPLTEASIKTGDVTEKRKDLNLLYLDKVREASGLDDVEERTKIEAGQRLSFNNIELLSGTASNLAETIANAIDAGQFGDIIAKAKVKTSQNINIPLGRGRNLQDLMGKEGTIAEGTIQEMLLKMMPMLTQQGEKAGSVRLIQSIIDRVGLTLPKIDTGPATARGQISRTLKSFFRFARASELNAIEYDNTFTVVNRETGISEPIPPENISDEALDSWVSKVNRASGRVQFSDAEDNALNQLINNSLEPLDLAVARSLGGTLVEDSETGIRAVVKGDKVLVELR